MDVFSLRDSLIDSYSKYVRSFLTIKDDRIHELVERELNAGFFWPEPLIQLNPAFEFGPDLESLIKQGTLHPECFKIFAQKKEDGTNLGPLRFYHHQVEGIKAAKSCENYVLTSGTGSGKSLSYIVPIVDHVLRTGSGNGIKAIIVYPMNALANSQLGELKKFLEFGYPKGQPPVTFKRYTGQESEEERQVIIANPPDILLTNYVMLELVLTRPRERKLVDALKDLRFLVLDELHTYRGRQGADVAFLVRRLHNLSGAKEILHIGTSATLLSSGSWSEIQKEISTVASTLFGVKVKPENIIGESLKRVTREYSFYDQAVLDQLKKAIHTPSSKRIRSTEEFINDVLASWIESTLGVQRDSDGCRLVRCEPMPIRGPDSVTKRLLELTGESQDICESAIRDVLLCARNFKDERGRSFFSFKLHQFISKGESVYASPEPEDKRYITLQAQQFVPGSNRKKVLLPLAFCRECGQEYYVVRRCTDDKGNVRYIPRELSDMQANDEDAEPGFLFISTMCPWPSEPEKIIDRLPDSWLDDVGGNLRIKKAKKKHLPNPIYISPDGTEDSGNLQACWFRAPFKFCMHCGVDYSSYQRSDFGKLATLGSEGRSTATTVLSLSAIQKLRQERELHEKAKKLLTFTDNRQDASLQAGHFNDFVEIALLRSALLKAIKEKAQEGLRHDNLTLEVFKALNLPLELYAINPNVEYLQKEKTQKALREVLGYYLYRDLKRGWRITSPNLEQTGLLRIDYLSLKEFCNDTEKWKRFHPVLANATASERVYISRVLLDYMRRELSIRVGFLDPLEQERIQYNSSQYLIPPWAIDENERMVHATVAFPCSRPGNRLPENRVYISPKGGFALFLKRRGTLSSIVQPPKVDDVQEIINDLLEALTIPGLVQRVVEPNGDIPPGYQLNASALFWLLGDGKTGYHDPIRVPNAPQEGHKTNQFFVSFYRSDNKELMNLEAREHTAQVPVEIREEREEAFREARLPILFCSPTMELGVDISQLNVVGMRNVPPTPSNYAQRSGRAGRSGQPALIITYCAAGSPHDQYFFRRPSLMVAGSVLPPKIDLANEELLRSHIHAIWLYETGLDLKASLGDVLDVEGDEPTLALKEHIKLAIIDKDARKRTYERAKVALLDAVRAFSETVLEGGEHQGDQWIKRIIDQIPQSFENACERWRNLYSSALAQVKRQNKIIQDASRSIKDRNHAKTLRNEAEKQLDLLLKTDEELQSDFYSYRYFASEGFIPGYNFPRLPLSAYIPGRRIRTETKEFLSRPRFLAISEFGPRSIIYHEGSRYIINKVILPVDADEKGITQQGVLCEECGYIHEAKNGMTPDCCVNCKSRLPMAWTNLFRMQNVSTKRRDRINSDEEERLRQGYDLRTAFKFNEKDGRPVIKTAVLFNGEGERLVTLKYGHAAVLWRINLGWKRRKNKAELGFVLDCERGYWARSDDERYENVAGDPMSPRKQRVVPFVEDRKNCILLKFHQKLSLEEAASLQAALKKAIQAYFHLEDSELQVEPLPSTEDRRIFLFYEAAEGGAGVLRRLIEEPEALSNIAREALSICHFDPETGLDLRFAHGAREECDAACYDCLLSYYNQRDHRLLDRKLLPSLLLSMASGKVECSPSVRSRDEHLERLLRLSESTLEKKWLHFIADRELRLPTHPQIHLEDCNVRIDFLYKDEGVAVFIDGPHHDNKDQRALDVEQSECLEDLGYHVIRFRYDEDWEDIVEQYPDLFGANEKEASPPTNGK